MYNVADDPIGGLPKQQTVKNKQSKSDNFNKNEKKRKMKFLGHIMNMDAIENLTVTKHRLRMFTKVKQLRLCSVRKWVTACEYKALKASKFDA